MQRWELWFPLAFHTHVSSLTCACVGGLYSHFCQGAWKESDSTQANLVSHVAPQQNQIYMKKPNVGPTLHVYRTTTGGGRVPLTLWASLIVPLRSQIQTCIDIVLTLNCRFKKLIQRAAQNTCKKHSGDFTLEVSEGVVQGQSLILAHFIVFLWFIF